MDEKKREIGRRGEINEAEARKKNMSQNGRRKEYHRNMEENNMTSEEEIRIREILKNGMGPTEENRNEIDIRWRERTEIRKEGNKGEISKEEESEHKSERLREQNV